MDEKLKAVKSVRFGKKGKVFIRLFEMSRELNEQEKKLYQYLDCELRNSCRRYAQRKKFEDFACYRFSMYCPRFKFDNSHIKFTALS